MKPMKASVILFVSSVFLAFLVQRYDHDKCWSNWSHTVSSCPQQEFYPRTLAEIKDIVHLALERNVTQVRCVGIGHSFSPLSDTDGYLIHTTHLNHIRLGTEPNQVVFQPGITVMAFDDFLEQHNLTLTSNVVLGEVTMGGVVMTGSRGTGRTSRTVSDVVVGMTLVDGTGAIRMLNDPHILSAVQLHLGLFGVVYEITLVAEPLFSVAITNQYAAWDDLMITPGVIETYLRENEWFELYWSPFLDQVFLKTAHRVNHSVEISPFYRTYQSLRDWCQIRTADILYRLIAFVPSWMPWASRVFNRLWPVFDARVDKIRYAIHHTHHIPLIQVRNAEYAFGIKSGDDLQIVRDLSQAIRQRIETLAQQGEYPADIVLNIRFTLPSQALLSPANQPGSQYVCWMEWVNSRVIPQGQEFLDREFGPLVMSMVPSALPHWPKSWQGVPQIYALLQQRYAERRTQFLQIRDELQVDPLNLFVNPGLQPFFIKQLGSSIGNTSG